MTLFSQAIAFAAKMHDGAVRKGTDIPYIVHPMEAAMIAATMTTDQAVLAAAVLHDVIEDCGVTEAELAVQFGTRVAELVMSETQLHRGDPKETWESRKQEALDKVAAGDRDVKILMLADKLSNMRAIRLDYHALGTALFARFNQHDPARHAWYYRGCRDVIADELGDTEAFIEFNAHVEEVFGSLDALSKEGAVRAG